MNRKHYLRLSAALARAKPFCSKQYPELFAMLVEDIAGVLKADNVSFDVARFRAAINDPKGLTDKDKPKGDVS